MKRNGTNPALFLPLVALAMLSACAETSKSSLPVTDPDNTTVIVKNICGDGVLTQAVSDGLMPSFTPY